MRQHSICRRETDGETRSICLRPEFSRRRRWRFLFCHIERKNGSVSYSEHPRLYRREYNLSQFCIPTFSYKMLLNRVLTNSHFTLVWWMKRALLYQWKENPSEYLTCLMLNISHFSFEKKVLFLEFGGGGELNKNKRNLLKQ